MTCPPLFDLASIAGNYGQMTGVLAGFAFTALVLLMTPTQAAERAGRQRHEGGAALALFGGFVALVVVTLLYSVLAGDDATQARPRAATVELIDGLIFGLAVVSLLQGLCLLARNAALDGSTVAVARVMTVVAFPTLAMYFVAQGASDTVAARAAAAGKGCAAQVPATGAWLTGVCAVVLAGSLSAPAQQVLARYRARCATVAPVLVITVSVVGAIVSGQASTMRPSLLLSPTALDLFLIGAALLLTAAGLMFSASGGTAAPTTRQRLGADLSALALGLMAVLQRGRLP